MGREGRRVNGGVKFVWEVAEKRRAFVEWLQRRYRDTYDRYQAESCCQTVS